MKDNAKMVASQPVDADCADMKEGNIWDYDGISIFQHSVGVEAMDPCLLPS